ncbi:MAG: Y-family DNA polymerase [Methyloligellaceae bacterium]
MKRYVSVWLPHWPIQRLKQTTTDIESLPPDNAPFALVESTEKGLVLFALNKTAQSLKLYSGQRLPDARAMVPSLQSAPAQRGRDDRTLKALARWCTRFTPAVNTDGNAGIWLEVSTSTHLFGNESALLKDIHIRLRKLGFTARLGLADSLGGAWAMAHYGPIRTPIEQRIIAPGQTLSSLENFPVAALRLSEDSIQLLKRLGLKRIKQLGDLPRPTLKRRFPSTTDADAVLHRLDQLLGKTEEPRKTLLPTTSYIARIAFPEPLITAEGVEAALQTLCHELCEKLQKDEKGGRQIILTIYRTDGSLTSVETGTSTPSRRPDHLARLLNEKIGNIDAGFGIDLMTLRATVHESLLPSQTSLAESQIGAQQTDAAELIDRLTNRLDKTRVFRLSPQESYIPERAQNRVPALESLVHWPEKFVPTVRRPLLLLDPPEAIKVIAEIPEGPPLSFTWRRVYRRVVQAEGPERISPEWWLEIPNQASGDPRQKEQEEGDAILAAQDRKTRDYYFVEDEMNGRYWIFRSGLYQSASLSTLPQWYLQGFFG